MVSSGWEVVLLYACSLLLFGGYFPCFEPSPLAIILHVEGIPSNRPLQAFPAIALS